MRRYNNYQAGLGALVVTLEDGSPLTIQTVSATVVDESGNPISDVNVYEVGQTSSIYTAKTNSSGRFTMRVSNLNGDLRFTHLQYKTTSQSISTTSESKKVYMEELVNELDEVIINDDEPNNNSTKNDNTVLWVAGILLAGVVIYAVSNSKKDKPVKVKA
jgi:hypothetical protein